MSGEAGGAPADDPARTQRERERAASRRSSAGGIGAAWRALTPDQKLAAIAAVALLFSMLVPWYQETGNALVRNKLVRIGDSKNAFQVYSFVEAAIFVVSAGVLVLLYARGKRRAFHLPGGDGTVIMAAGLWVMFLIFYRQLDKPDGRREGPISTSIGVEWGIFVALLLGALLAYAGYRIRAHHTPEPTVDNVAPANEPPSRPPPPDWLADDGESPTTVPRRAPARPREDRPVDGELAVDEPAEYRPPPRRT
jgi:hypothetical protein